MTKQTGTKKRGGGRHPIDDNEQILAYFFHRREAYDEKIGPISKGGLKIGCYKIDADGRHKPAMFRQLSQPNCERRFRKLNKERRDTLDPFVKMPDLLPADTPAIVRITHNRRGISGPHAPQAYGLLPPQESGHPGKKSQKK